MIKNEIVQLAMKRAEELTKKFFNINLLSTGEHFMYRQGVLEGLLDSWKSN